jgi:hypothetical protein
MSFKSKWETFKAWFKRHLPGWIHDLIQQVISWLIPFLLEHGFSALVSQKQKTLHSEVRWAPVPIPPEIEHEDDC